MEFIVRKFQKHFLLPLLWKTKIFSLMWICLNLAFGEKAMSITIEYLLISKAEILMPNWKEPTYKYSYYFLTGTEFTLRHLHFHLLLWFLLLEIKILSYGSQSRQIIRLHEQDWNIPWPILQATDPNSI